MKFKYIAPVWITDFEVWDFSLGIHICWRGRIDFHIWRWMLSIGVVPIYEFKEKLVASSNSFHDEYKHTERRLRPFRAGSTNL